MIYNGDINTQYEQLTGFADYEIKLVNGYAKIRKIKTKHEQKYSFHKQTGYYRIALNGKWYRLHRIIAQHYINHDSEHIEVDHIDHNRLNYNITNLRWCTKSENLKNRSKSTRNTDIEYEYIDQLPDNAVGVCFYNNHFFRNYFYADQEFFYWSMAEQKVLLLTF